MFYGLLLEAANAQVQKPEAAQTNRCVGDEEEVWCLGMEAWVSCDLIHSGQRTHC